MKVDRIIFWQPFASPHQEAFLEAVAEQFPGEVILAVESEMPAERIAQGWPKPEHKLVRVHNVSSPAIHAALTKQSGPDSLHIFTGFFSHPLVWKAFQTLAPSQARLAIFSEAPEQPLLTGWLKRLRGRWLAKLWATRFAFVLAVGNVGCEFFERMGFPAKKIVPFGYFSEVLASPAPAPRSAESMFKFVSAGQLIRRKGIDLLIEACAHLPPTGWRLDIYGDGPERAKLERSASSRGLADRIAFHATVPTDELRSLLASADCTVLPSRFDGWGMLVNESLAIGTPMICTDRCGATLLFTECGLVAASPPPRVSELAAALRHAVTAGPPDAIARAAIAAAVRRSGSPAAGARRLLSTVAAA